jgi:hypothetical protein
VRTYFFDVIIDRDLCDGAEMTDRVFEAFEGDVSPAVRAGVPLLSCSVEAETLDWAIRRVLEALPPLGAKAVRVEVEPGELAAAA